MVKGQAVAMSFYSAVVGCDRCGCYKYDNRKDGSPNGLIISF